MQCEPGSGQGSQGLESGTGQFPGMWTASVFLSFSFINVSPSSVSHGSGSGLCHVALASHGAIDFPSLSFPWKPQPWWADTARGQVSVCGPSASVRKESNVVSGLWTEEALSVERAEMELAGILSRTGAPRPRGPPPL